MDAQRIPDDVKRNKAAVKAKIEAIRLDGHLTPAGKRAQIAAAYTAAAAQHRALMASYQAEIQSERERLARVAFGPASRRPDDEQNFRDALKMAADPTTKRAALLSRAKLSHDTNLAKALAMVATLASDDWATFDAAAEIDSDVAALLRHEQDYGVRRTLQRKVFDSGDLGYMDRPAEVDQAAANAAV